MSTNQQGYLFRWTFYSLHLYFLHPHFFIYGMEPALITQISTKPQGMAEQQGKKNLAPKLAMWSRAPYLSCNRYILCKLLTEIVFSSVLLQLHEGRFLHQSSFTYTVSYNNCRRIIEKVKLPIHIIIVDIRVVVIKN